jgi:hypothetical protein
LIVASVLGCLVAVGAPARGLASHVASGSGSPDGQFVAAFGGDRYCGSLGVFSTSGHLVRVLQRHDDVWSMAVGPTGRSLYYRNVQPSQGWPTTCRATSRRQGWRSVLRIPIAGGRPVDTGRRGEYYEAFSANGVMVAWANISLYHPRIVVHNRRTGTTRKIVVADQPGAGNPTEVTGLAWSPDGSRLAVGLAATASNSWLQIIRPRRVHRLNLGREVPGCGGTCGNPGFDTSGHLWFTRYIHYGYATEIREKVGPRSFRRHIIHQFVLAATFNEHGAALVTVQGPAHTVGQALLLVDSRGSRSLAIPRAGFPAWIPSSR